MTFFYIKLTTSVPNYKTLLKIFFVPFYKTYLLKEEIVSKKRHFLNFSYIDYTTFNTNITIFTLLIGVPGH